MDDVPLPGMPDLPPPALPRPAAGVRFSRYKSTRTLCDVCMQLIHVQGLMQAPFPRSARWRRSTPSGTAYVCEQHKETYL